MGAVQESFSILRFEEIEVDKLLVNPSNDRHGPMGSESAAIAWLFENKARDMKALAKNISETGRLFDSPLVIKDGDKYLVKDGNRRVTSLKLLINPRKSPIKYRDFFTDLNRRANVRLPHTITCQVEDSPATADEIIGLRHNGKQEGRGQLAWGTREKANHSNRISGNSDYEWPQLVEKYLTKHGYEAEANTIQRSTLDRVIKTKKRRQVLGISKTEKGELHATHGDDNLIPLLRKLVTDMSSGSLSLANTLRAADVDQYLSSLQGKGFIVAQQAQPEKHTTAQVDKPKGPKKKLHKPPERKTLIPSHVNYQFSWVSGQSKVQLVWEELQHSLRLKDHIFSIAIVLRVLLELSAKNYRDQFQLKDQNSLSKNLSQNLDVLHKNQTIDTKQRDDIRRILHDKSSICSVENLQRVVHSSSQVLSNDDLITLWDCIEPLVLSSIRAVQAKKLQITSK